MAISFRSSLRGLSIRALRNHSTEANLVRSAVDPSEFFRTDENNPINHNSSHLNRFYLLSKTTGEAIFYHNGIPKRLEKQWKTFAENAILIREPALDIISCLKISDYSRPINKYVLYGESGSGKTTTLIHILHYAYKLQKLIIHIPWVPYWFRRSKGGASSSKKQKGFYDLPLSAASWLLHFEHQNSALLSKLHLNLSKDYTWNKRESHSAGSPLLSLINFGIARVKYACGVVDALIDEIKIASTAGKCNTLVAIDGYNAFYGDEKNVRNKELQYVKPDEITLTQSFIKLVKYDWCNGAVVLIVDEIAVYKEHQSYLPRYLLGKEGFDHLDPFLPVEVSNYTLNEFETVLEYYKNRKWIRNIDSKGQRELELLTNRNPFKLMCYTAPL